MAIHNDLDWKVSIGPTYASTVDTLAEFAALTTYVEIGEIESIGPFGDSAEITTFRTLNRGRLRKNKNTRDAGDLEIVVGRDALDPGQIAVRAAEKTSFRYAFKVEASDKLDANDTNSIFYFGALVATRPVAPGADATRETYRLAIDTEIFEQPMTVVP